MRWFAVQPIYATNFCSVAHRCSRYLIHFRIDMDLVDMATLYFPLCLSISFFFLSIANLFALPIWYTNRTDHHVSLILTRKKHSNNPLSSSYTLQIGLSYPNQKQTHTHTHTNSVKQIRTIGILQYSPVVTVKSHLMRKHCFARTPECIRCAQNYGSNCANSTQIIVTWHTHTHTHPRSHTHAHHAISTLDHLHRRHIQSPTRRIVGAAVVPAMVTSRVSAIFARLASQLSECGGQRTPQSQQSQ